MMKALMTTCVSNKIMSICLLLDLTRYKNSKKTTFSKPNLIFQCLTHHQGRTRYRKESRSLNYWYLLTFFLFLIFFVSLLPIFFPFLSSNCSLSWMETSKLVFSLTTLYQINIIKLPKTNN